MTLIKAKVGPKGQAVIPKPVRDALGIHPGDEVYYSTHEDHAHLERVPDDEWAAYWASVETIDFPPDFDIDAAIEAGMEEEMNEL